MPNLPSLLLLLLSIVPIPQIHSARILLAPAHGAASHTKGLYPLAAHLASDPTNQIVMLQISKLPSQYTKAPQNSGVIDRYFDSPMREGETDESHGLPSEVLWGYFPLAGVTMFIPWMMFGDMCSTILEDAGKKREFYSMIEDEGRIDMVIVDDIFTPCGMLVAVEARSSSNASKIVFIPAHGAASHTKSMYPLAAHLASDPSNRVIVLQISQLTEQFTKAPSKSQVIDRYLDAPLRHGESLETAPGIPTDVLWGYFPLGGVTIFVPWMFFGMMCSTILEDEGKRAELFGMIREEGPIDMVIVDDLCSPCGMLVAVEARRLFNASVINFGTTILMPQSQQTRGLPIHRTLYPSVLTPIMGHYDHRRFLHRLHTMIDGIAFDLVVRLIDYRLPIWLGMPDNLEIVPGNFAADSDLLIASLSPMLEFTKPRTNDVIELDVNCPAKANLSEKYRRFVEDPRSKGTILLAMGHFADWDIAPRAAFDSFFEAFSNLTEYRFVWQYVSKKDNPRKTPANVLMDEWVPQAALLYHPKTKAFISHCGGKSFRESICGGVPIVAMPMFAEQYRNSAIAHKKRIATFLDKTSLSPSIVLESLTTILDDPSFARRAKSLQRQLEDQIVKPLDLGKFWIDFLLRHEKASVAKYFRSMYRNLSIMAADSVDLTVLGFIGIVFAVRVVS